MTTTDEELYLRAHADVLLEEVEQRLDAFEERNSPSAQKIIHEHAGPKVEVENVVSMEPVAEAIDRMAYEMAKRETPDVVFDTEPLKDFLKGLTQAITSLKEEAAESRKEMAAHREILKEMIVAWSQQKATINEFKPNIISPPEPSIIPAIEGLTKLVEGLLKKMDEKKPIKSAEYRVTHGEKESVIKRI